MPRSVPVFKKLKGVFFGRPGWLCYRPKSESGVFSPRTQTFINKLPRQPPQESRPSGAAGNRKRPIESLGDETNIRKGKYKKILKIENGEIERNNLEGCLLEIKNETVLPNEELDLQNVHFNPTFCTPGIIKEEHPCDLETSTGYNGTQTVTAVPEYMLSEVKTEPPEEEREGSVETETKPQDISCFTWRCPLISCPEMFHADFEMFEHLRLKHAVRGPVLPSQSKAVLEPQFACIAPTSANRESSETLPVI